MGLWLIRLPRFLFFLRVLGFFLRLFLAEVDCDKRDVPDEYRQKQNRHHRRRRAHRDEHYLAEEIHERHVGQRTEGQRARFDRRRDGGERYPHAYNAQKTCRAERSGRLARVRRRGDYNRRERDEQGDGKEYNKGDKIALEFQKSVRELGCAAFDEVSEKTVSREKLDDAFDAQILYNI